MRVDIFDDIFDGSDDDFQFCCQDLQQQQQLGAAVVVSDKGVTEAKTTLFCSLLPRSPKSGILKPGAAYLANLIVNGKYFQYSESIDPTSVKVISFFPTVAAAVSSFCKNKTQQ